jgi:hypothetical protein
LVLAGCVGKLDLPGFGSSAGTPADTSSIKSIVLGGKPTSGKLLPDGLVVQAALA